MATMMRCTEVNVISVDKEEELWTIEGEVTFEEQLSYGFEATYNPDTDEFELVNMDEDPGDYDHEQIKDMIVEAAMDF